jgi:CRISPR-associated protein Csm4
MHLVKLAVRPGAQFHLGSHVPFDKSVLHDTDSIIHSDTLFSALVNIGKKIDLAEEIVEELSNRNSISSAFYLLENGTSEPVYFLPRPTIPLLDCADYKQVKRMAFVSKGMYEKGIELHQWSQSDAIIYGNNWIATIDEMKALLEDKYDAGKVRNIRLSGKANIPQVRVHTDQMEHNYYQTANLQIADNSDLYSNLRVHFYCLLEHKPNNALQSVFNLLPHEGIGGQRSTGCGQVLSVETGETTLFDSLKGEYLMTLSKVIPTAADLEQMKLKSFYQTSVRGGRIIDNAQQKRLKQVRMIDEGAVFGQPVEGTVSDLRPEEGDMPYLRYGKAFLINLPKHLCHA